jgi:DNA-binding MurR/RpiR family transcriptional regulator
MSAYVDQRDWRTRISAVFDHLSPSNRVVAAYLLEQPSEAAFMTGSDLAAHLDLDPATIVRFAQMLGYPGYPELAAEVRASVREVFDHAHEIQQPAEGTAATAWQEGLRESAANIATAARETSWRDARRFAKLLQGANQVIVIAAPDEALLGEWLSQTLLTAGVRAYSVVSGMPFSAGKNDLLLGVALADGAAVGASLSRAGARAVALASPDAARTLHTELTLTCAAGDDPMLAHTSFAALVEALRSALLSGG